MSETVPLESVSRWSGLSPWVALLPWRMAGAASRNQVRGGLCARPCAGQAPGIKSGAGSVVGHRSHPRPESGRRPVRRVWGWGKRDGSPQGSGWGRQRPPCGVLPGGTERPCKQSQEGDDPGSKQGIEAPRLPYGSSTVACATTAPGHSPVRAEGKPSPRAADPAGCAPRRPCRAASASPGPPRPQASRRRRWAPGRQPCPCPGCRPASRSPNRRRTRSVHSAKAHRA